MKPQIKSQLEPEDLLGHNRYGLGVFDADDRLVLANQLFFQLSGSPAGLALGKSASELLAHFPALPSIRNPKGGVEGQVKAKFEDRVITVERRHIDPPTGPLSVISLTDTTEFDELFDQTNTLTLSSDSEGSIIDRRAEAAVLIRYFIKFSGDHSSVSDCLADASRLGMSLFPEGGAMLSQNNGVCSVVSAWGSMAEIAGGGGENALSLLGNIQASEIELYTDDSSQVHWYGTNDPSLEDISALFVRSVKLALLNVTS